MLQYFRAKTSTQTLSKFTSFTTKRVTPTLLTLYSSHQSIQYLHCHNQFSSFSTQIRPTQPMSFVVTDEAQFDATIAAAQKVAADSNKQLYVYITAAVNPETGLSWCPDCVSAAPFMQVVKAQENNVVVECPVDRSRYRSGIPTDCVEGEGCKITKHPYKTHPKFQLTAVPTLFKFDMQNLGENPAKLVESDVYNPSKIAAFTGINQSLF